MNQTKTKSLPALPSYDSLSLFSQSFAYFFSDKIHKLNMSLIINCISVSPLFPSSVISNNFSFFIFVTTDDVSKLPSQSPDTNCDLDPIPTSVLKQCSDILLPTITNIINLSISKGIFPDKLQSCFVHPHMKKSISWIKMISVIIVIYLTSHSCHWSTTTTLKTQ